MEEGSEKVTAPVTFHRAVLAVINDELRKVYTSLPGVVERYDPATRRAHVKPQVQEHQADGTLAPLPVIAGVPVAFPMAGSDGLRFDVAPGTTGILHFTMRSIERWLDRGGDSPPDDPRRFALTDAVFVPGLAPFSQTEGEGVADALVLSFGGAKVRLHGDRIALGNAQAELLDLVSQLLAVVQTGTNSGGPVVFSPPAGPGSLPDLAAKLALIKGTL